MPTHLVRAQNHLHREMQLPLQIDDDGLLAEHHNDDGEMRESVCARGAARSGSRH
jgi:hypothetical protein